MTTATCTRRFGSILVTLVAASFATARAVDGDTTAGTGRAQLTWTPHRASATPAAESGPAEPQSTAPARLQSVPSGGSASVTLPDDVPAVLPTRDRPASATPARAGTVPARQARRPAAADTSLGIDVFRTPTRGGASRPILADESPAGARRQVERLGSYAPRPVGGRRPERLTAGVDALPSVMRQGPDAAAAPPAAVEPEPIATPAPRNLGATPDDMPPGMEIDASGDPTMMGGPDGLMLGEYPSQLHVESFYDDPYACEDDDPLCHHSGRFCAWLRQFGRPYYGWRWYRDFTAAAGPVAFTNAADLGFNSNFGFNEYLNQGMPFWNAFGVGWQVGVRGTQTNFQDSNVNFQGGRLHRTGRDQVFVTTGFFTRAFEGRGLQGGAVYDYLHDNLYDTIDVAQLRYEVSYVWGYHEVGFWGASNIGDQTGIFSPVRKNPGVASTLDLYTAFYRLQFGDANEWKVWGGGTSYGDGIIGSIVRAPMSRSWGLEGFFTYVIPGNSLTINVDGKGTTSNYSPAAWNVGVNVVFYPGGRSRRSLASPYRPLFDVADNGTMIRRLGAATP